MVEVKRKFVICFISFVLIWSCDGLTTSTRAPAVTQANNNVCKFSLKTDFSDKEPILLKQSKFGYENFEPNTAEISLNTKDQIFVACPGLNNKITGVNKDVASVKCVNGKTVTVEGTQMEFNKINCDKRASGQFLDTAEPCGKRGVKKYLGHKVGDKWYTIISVCYDQKRGQSLYSTHTLFGSSIDYSKEGKIDGNFKVGGLDFRVKPDQFYVPENQKKLFQALFESPMISDQYLTIKSHLVKVQLSPREDFVYLASQYAPYYFINTLPQWNAINDGNWKSLEAAVRKTASSLKENFKIITGSHDILTLKGRDNKDTLVYMDEMSTMPVPKFIWKIMYSVTSKKAIAFVSLNNPYVKTVPANENLCTDVCDRYGWADPAWKQAAKGIIYCCDVKQLMEKVKTIPNIGEIKGVLEGKLTAAAAAPSPASRTSAAGCLLNYKTDFPDKEPVLLKKQGQEYQLFDPKADAVSLAPKQEIYLLCPGASNKIEKLFKNIVSATCDSGKMLKIEGKNYAFHQLGCKQKVSSDFKLTKNECSGQGLIKLIGHKVDDNTFVALSTVCYDHKQGVTLYAEHTLYGASVGSGKAGDKILEYRVAGLDLKVNADEIFKKDSQKLIFDKLLGDPKLTSKYINPNSYLARAHLSPAGDFVFGPSKYASYFYVNVIPQWQSINNGNWKSVENAVRSTASAYNSNFEIHTGSHGTLSLKNSKGENMEIYLDVLKTLPVPKFTWKIMYSVSLKKAIAFVSLNNPFVDTISKDDYICPNNCKNHGWGSPDWEKKEKGLVYCCDVKELLKVVDTAPAIGPIDGILEAKKKK